jgi:hypothetical protein
MSLTEVDLAMGVSFSATNSGQGSMSQTFVIYSFGNSTSLASVASVSGSSSWSTGTANGAAPWTSIQGGWSGNLVHPITFASTAVPQGEYVFGHEFELSMANAGHSASLYGDVGFGSSAITAFTAAPTVASALSTGGLFTGSAFTASASSALTAFSATPTNATVLSSSGLSAVTGITSFINTAATNATVFGITHASTAGSTYASASSTAVIAATWAAIPWIAGTNARTDFTGVTAASVLSNAGTSAYAGFLGSEGLSSGSFLSASAGVNALSNAGTAAMTLGNAAVLSFGFVGTASNSTNMNQFIAGILSTAAAPASIALTNAALTYGGSAVLVQPWFQLCGS